jgi:hypothetical protein
MTPNRKGNLEFIRVTESNLGQFAEGMSELEEAVWGRQTAPAYWGWRYFENPTRRSTTVVALREDRVVGKMGGVCLPMVVGGKQQTVTLVEGLSMLPSERSWDCLRGLMAANFLEGQRDSVSLGFGFATKKWTAIHHKMGLRSLGRTPVWLGFLDLKRILKRRSVPDVLALLGGMAGLFIGVRRERVPLSGVEIQPIERFDADTNGLWQTLEPLRWISVVKDTSYLRWRYDSCPGYSYRKLAAFRRGRVEGVAVYSVSQERKNGYLLELLADKDDVTLLRRLAVEAIDAMDQEEVGLIAASFPPGTAAAQALGAFGFKAWGSLFWNIETVLRGSWPEEPSGERGLKRWNFSLGDWLYH